MQQNQTRQIPISLNPLLIKEELTEYVVVISKQGFVKYASSDRLHATRFISHWHGILYRIKEYNIENAKTKALSAWQSGKRETVL